MVESRDWSKGENPHTRGTALLAGNFVNNPYKVMIKILFFVGVAYFFTPKRYTKSNTAQLNDAIIIFNIDKGDCLE